MKKQDKLTALDKGIRLFNEGRFFECHEVLEELWIEDRSEYRDLYQGLIKSAVALYHAEKGNFIGTRKVLVSGLKQLRLYSDRETPVEIDPLINILQDYLEAILSGEGESIPYPKLVIHPDRVK